MGETEPSPERLARRAARRASLEKLTGGVRELIDATVRCDVDPEEIDEIGAALATLTERLCAHQHGGVYSGLLGRGPIDHTEPSLSVPLSPWAGRFNPIAPPLKMRFENSEVFGNVTLGKPYIGPPGAAHGGVVAGIMDQLLASAGQSIGVAGVTANMTVRFRKPTPLETRLVLHAWADPREDESKKRTVHAEIRTGDVVTAEADALIIRSARVTQPN
ncbi:MAG: hotdog domain-containing protein [Candidatus Binatia bacterium]|nr:hotdog domain-containing protein [Candidatus Binatia bacterium]